MNTTSLTIWINQKQSLSTLEYKDRHSRVFVGLTLRNSASASTYHTPPAQVVRGPRAYTTMASKTRAKIRARAHKIRACVRAKIKARRLETQRLDFFAFPPELRILIYRQLFANSRIYFHPQTGRFEGNRPATFTTTGQWNILLTCKTVSNFLELLAHFIRRFWSRFFH